MNPRFHPRLTEPLSYDSVGLGRTAPSQPLVLITITERLIIIMAVNARFYVAAIERYASNGNRRAGWADPAPIGNVTLRPVTRGEANAEWASATPGGEIKMTVRGSALPWFEDRLGVELAITFDDVPAASDAATE